MARGWSKKWARAQLKFFQAFEIGEQHPHLQDRKRARTTVEITTDYRRAGGAGRCGDVKAALLLGQDGATGMTRMSSLPPGERCIK